MDLERPYSFSEQEGKGRFVVAARDIRKGEVVLIEEACVVAINRRHAFVTCSHCGATSDGTGTVFQLSPEDTLRYCSEHCISVEFPVHQLEVPVMVATTAFSEVFGQESYRTLIRLACQRKLHGEQGMHARTPRYPQVGRANDLSTVMSLEAATALMDATTLNSLTRSARAFSKALRRVDIELSQDEIVHLVLVVQCNAHNIKTVGGAPIGIGLFPTTSMMNHSCFPNCAHSFTISKLQPPRLVMRALRDVSAGDELAYSYVPLYQSTKQRQAQLSAAYSFVCSCPRCSGTSSTLLQSDEVLEDCDLEESRTDVKKCLQTIETCVSLTIQAASSQKSRLLKRLLGLLSDIDLIGLLNPAHRTLLQAYVCIADAVLEVAFIETAENGSGAADFDYFAVSYAFSALAIGCVSSITGIESAEIGRMAEVSARSLAKLFSSKFTKMDQKIMIQREYLMKYPVSVVKKHLGCQNSVAIERYIAQFNSLAIHCASKQEPMLDETVGFEAGVKVLLKLAISNFQAELAWDFQALTTLITKVSIS